jgi:calcineurin-like phosphoesterase family protein
VIRETASQSSNQKPPKSSYPVGKHNEGPLTRLQRFITGGSEKTYLVSDLHFGHEMTLLFVPRPFNSTHDMNKALVQNWNDTVKPGDVVWNLGDLSWTKPVGFWTRMLNGKILHIKGNHDRPAKWKKRYAILRRGEHTFFLVHDPDDPVIPRDYQGWIIHGHHHGGRDINGNSYPFIDGVNKRINVVCELTDYKPVDMDWLVSLNLDMIKRMDNTDDTPEQWADGEERPPLPHPRATPRTR